MTETLPAELADALRGARRIAALTGAGVSAESGIPTFRGARSGLWANFDPMQLATPEGFSRDPALVWRWYQWRRGLLETRSPNPGHHALAAMGRAIPEFILITQNVDGFHHAAGSDKVLELHGSIRRNICSRTRRLIEDAWILEHAAREPPPSPHHPDGLARPDVVWFGEALDEKILQNAFAAAETCELMIVAGTAGEVEPAASLPRIARTAGAKIVDINPDTTSISRLADWHLAGTSATWLPRLASCVGACATP